MLRLPTFAKYPQNVKQDLAKMLWYDRFKDGRVIVKQGDPGTRMYFVVSGPGVSLRRTDRLDKEGQFVILEPLHGNSVVGLTRFRSVKVDMKIISSRKQHHFLHYQCSVWY